MRGGFSEEAIELHNLALSEARRLSHDFLGCEHFLLGLIAFEAAPASKVLRDHGVTREAAAREILRQHLPEFGTGDEIRNVTPQVGVVQAVAAVEAERLGEPRADSAHVLLGLLTVGESVAVGALRKLNVDFEGLARDVLVALDVPAATRERYLSERAATIAGRTPESGTM